MPMRTATTIIANFYTHFSHEAQSAYSVLLPRSLDTFQCRTYSAQFPLPREHSLPGIAAYNGAGKFKHSNLSPPTGLWRAFEDFQRVFMIEMTLSSNQFSFFCVDFWYKFIYGEKI